MFPLSYLESTMRIDALVRNILYQGYQNDNVDVIDILCLYLPPASHTCWINYINLYEGIPQS